VEKMSIVGQITKIGQTFEKYAKFKNAGQTSKVG
jgi:hypothetical protein